MWNAIEAVGSVVAAVFTGVGLIAVAIQMRSAKKAMRSQFITQLETNFHAHYEIYSILEYKKDGADYDQGLKTLQEIPVRDLMRFMGFFENLKLIIDDQVITMNTVNKLFSYRFFLLVNDPYIQEKILYNTQYKYYIPSVFALHQQWVKFRRGRRLPIPFEEHDLKASNPNGYRDEISAYAKS